MLERDPQCQLALSGRPGQGQRLAEDDFDLRLALAKWRNAVKSYRHECYLVRQDLELQQLVHEHRFNWSFEACPT